ncbi:MAG TPA: hypothetical protein ENJ82_09085 [Bacteroidetes bacterium]|nr:hypothetical protein [Bacteroidota bacterium]
MGINMLLSLFQILVLGQWMAQAIADVGHHFFINGRHLPALFNTGYKNRCFFSKTILWPVLVLILEETIFRKAYKQQKGNREIAFLLLLPEVPKN